MTFFKKVWILQFVPEDVDLLIELTTGADVGYIYEKKCRLYNFNYKKYEKSIYV